MPIAKRRFAGEAVPATAAGPKQIRQDRYETRDLACRLKLGEESYDVLNYSPFGFAIQSKLALPPLVDAVAELTIDGELVAKVTVRKVREEMLEDGIKTGLEITSEPISVERLMLFPEICRAVRSLAQHPVTRIPGDFSLKVYELRDILAHFEQKLMAARASHAPSSWEQVAELDNTVIELASRALFNLFQKFNPLLSKALEGATDEVRALACTFFREQLQPFVYQSPLARRSLAKPLGYPGDYEMLSLICRNETMGSSLFARCLERCFLDHPEPQAVRNRVEYMTERLRRVATGEGERKVLSVVSGPALEIEQFVQTEPQPKLDRVSFDLLDQDALALKNTQWRLRRLEHRLRKRAKTFLVQGSLIQLMETGVGKDKYDLVYSAGLFDYLPDAVARRLAQRLFTAVRPGGSLIIGNFDASAPTQFGMGLIFDWHLIYRAATDLERIFDIPEARVRIEREPLGINLFCVLEKA